jgi:hypothetical protein
MTTLTGRNARTLSGYVDSLLDYPRWIIERDVDFTACRHQGSYAESDESCGSCRFGEACYWLKLSHAPASQNDPLPQLLNALATAANYLSATYSENHEPGCQCETCLWLRQARRFLRSHGH